VESCSRASAPPNAHGSTAITITADPANRFVKADAGVEVTAVVRVLAQRAQRGERPPANIALLVDTSGSMEGRALEEARAASLALLGALGPKDRLAVVVFHAKTEVLLPSTALADADLGELRAAIGRMQARGTTDMAGGLRAALAEVMRNYDARGVNRIILLGDGVPNDPAPIEATLAQASQHRIAITALGLGLDYDESLMGHVALATGGRFHYVSDASKVATFFHDEVARVHDACARNARLVVTPGPGVVIDSVVGQATVRNGANVEVALGDLSYGDRRDLVVKAHGTSHADGSSIELLDATLTFAEGADDGTVEKSAFLGLRATSDTQLIAKSHDPDVEREAARVEEAAKTVKAIEDERRQLEMPRPSPSTGVVAPAAPQRPPSLVKAEHDRALDVLQLH
jgi:Ca-activated chloride channel family protein